MLFRVDEPSPLVNGTNGQIANTGTGHSLQNCDNMSSILVLTSKNIFQFETKLKDIHNIYINKTI